HFEELGGAPKLRYASPIGLVKNDRVMDWTDAYDKLKAATPVKNLGPLLASLRPGAQVLFVYPVTNRAADWDAPWTQLVRRRRALARDHARGVPAAAAHVAHLLERQVPRLPAARPRRDQEARADRAHARVPLVRLGAAEAEGAGGDLRGLGVESLRQAAVQPL